MADFIDRGGKGRKSGPHVPIVEPTGGQQWPTLTCPFLDQGERSFIERFVKVEVGVDELKREFAEAREESRDTRRVLRNAIIAVIVGILVSIAATSYRVSRDAADARTPQTQGAKK